MMYMRIVPECMYYVDDCVWMDVVCVQMCLNVCVPECICVDVCGCVCLNVCVWMCVDVCV